MSLAPIALFVYKRPAHTRRTIGALQENDLAAESDIVIFSDGPRTPADEKAVGEVREYIRTVGGFKTIRIIERESNWGLANSIVNGVTGLCERYGKVIVLEDDLVVSRAFLDYMNRALERYAESDRVMQVSGYTLVGRADKRAFFLPLTTSWGWATWQRAWRYFDADARGYEVLRKDPGKRKAFDLGGAYPYFELLELQLRGRVDSWAIRWWLSVFLHEGLVLYPGRSLVQNTGFDGSGTHGRARAFNQAGDTAAGAIEFPEQVAVSAQELDTVTRYLRKNRPGALRRRIKEILSWRG